MRPYVWCVVVCIAVSSGTAAQAAPMDAWRQTQAMGYQRQRVNAAHGAKLPSGTSTTLIRPLSVKRPTSNATTKTPAPEQPTATTATATTATASNDPETTADAPSTEPGLITKLAKKIRALLASRGVDKAGSKKQPVALTGLQAAVGTPLVAATNAPIVKPVAGGFTYRAEPRHRLPGANPTSLFILRRARLISEAEYQTAMRTLLGR